VALVVGQTTSAITADFGSMEFFFASNKRCLSKNKSGNLICRGVFFVFLNFSELFELTFTDPQLAPPSGESCFSMNKYLFIARMSNRYPLTNTQFIYSIRDVNIAIALCT
jgi:hypothetical protein